MMSYKICNVKIAYKVVDIRNSKYLPLSLSQWTSMKLFFLYLLPVRDTFWAKYELALVLLVQDYPLGGGPLKMVLIVNATQTNF